MGALTRTWLAAKAMKMNMDGEITQHPAQCIMQGQGICQQGQSLAWVGISTRTCEGNRPTLHAMTTAGEETVAGRTVRLVGLPGEGPMHHTASGSRSHSHSCSGLLQK